MYQKFVGVWAVQVQQAFLAQTAEITQRPDADKPAVAEFGVVEFNFACVRILL